MSTALGRHGSLPDLLVPQFRLPGVVCAVPRGQIACAGRRRCSSASLGTAHTWRRSDRHSTGRSLMRMKPASTVSSRLPHSSTTVRPTTVCLHLQSVSARISPLVRFGPRSALIHVHSRKNLRGETGKGAAELLSRLPQVPRNACTAADPLRPAARASASRSEALKPSPVGPSRDRATLCDAGIEGSDSYVSPCRRLLVRSEYGNRYR